MKYFIGNWKMFGIEKSFKILKKINLHIKKDFYKKRYKVMFAVPNTLISNYSKYNALRNKDAGVGYARKIGMDYALKFR